MTSILLVHGSGVAFYARERNGRFYLYFQTSTRFGPQGDPTGYPTFAAAHTAACDYCTP